ncbi:PIN domain-containing protein [Conexibacter sp. JD483]|uniref:PIN domain-containing protein n=1 Tax=unclassified Conexibacter TaxID=2627773 RepID=UPI00271D0430|nr:MULTISPECIES: PIN domain-containing protein [unclassified Conexibacter]MDO8189375.1 PIN domain-containing protein [Conexibacter sp. CPCC 205706]MDO8201082.1 PIN domain-containing protein [Conexibacter sp. CPCC 205762]MDR9372456.1 PIN domain-containing protein [Conexibacter sp. JD483]
MAILIDTSVLIDIERGRSSLDAVTGDDDRAISIITQSELLHGVHRAADDRIRARRQAFVEHILAAFDPIPIDGRVARAHAAAWAQLDAAGTPIGAHDLWIGATALAHGYSVATANPRDFERIPGLTVRHIKPVS